MLLVYSQSKAGLDVGIKGREEKINPLFILGGVASNVFRFLVFSFIVKKKIWTIL